MSTRRGQMTWLQQTNWNQSHDLRGFQPPPRSPNGRWLAGGTQPKYMKRALMRLKPHNLRAMSTILDATMVVLCNSAIMGSLNNIINERHSALQPIFVFTRVITYLTTLYHI